MRAALAAVALFVALAPAAQAQTGATTRTFDDLDPGPLNAAYSSDLFIGDTCEQGVVGDDPDPAAVPDDQAALITECDGFFVQFVDEPQAQVSLNAWAVTPSFAAASLAPTDVTLSAFQFVGDGVEVEVATVTDTIETEEWSPLTVSTPGGEPTIDYVRVNSQQSSVTAIDDLTYSPQLQPDTLLTSGPSGTVASRAASFGLHATVDGSTFECSLDGAAFAPCTGPANYDGLAEGPHTFRARAVDPYGNLDPTPAERTWAVAFPPPPSGPDLGPDGDGVPDDRDNCPDAANADQADEDEDAVGDACEILPSGDIEPVAGLRTTVEAVAGEVFVRLPAGAAAAQLPRGFVPLKGIFRSTAASGEFVPLKGIASIPVGSTVDARRGQLALTAAERFPRPRDTRAGTQSGRFAAAIFTIRQRRRVRDATRRARVARRPTTDLVMRTPSGGGRACASSATRPPKGIVRTLTGTVTGGAAKGTFRAVGKASITTVRRGTWITQDRCNGTLTEVGRGRAAVFDRARDRTVTIRAGQAYLARARLFQARKGRRRP